MIYCLYIIVVICLKIIYVFVFIVIGIYILRYFMVFILFFFVIDEMYILDKFNEKFEVSMYFELVKVGFRGRSF